MVRVRVREISSPFYYQQTWVYTYTDYTTQSQQQIAFPCLHKNCALSLSHLGMYWRAHWFTVLLCLLQWPYRATNSYPWFSSKSCFKSFVVTAFTVTVTAITAGSQKGKNISISFNFIKIDENSFIFSSRIWRWTRNENKRVWIKGVDSKSTTMARDDMNITVWIF